MEFLNRILGIPSVSCDHVEPAGKPVEREPDEFGVENISLDDLSVKFAPEVLRDHLPVFGDSHDIITIHRDNPAYLNARRSKCETGCDGCSSDSGNTGCKKQKEEDK
jgi:hypothetical protein